RTTKRKIEFVDLGTQEISVFHLTLLIIDVPYLFIEFSQHLFLSKRERLFTLIYNNFNWLLYSSPPGATSPQRADYHLTVDTMIIIG
ncbi:MAG: hypothetical protein CSB34_03330, partial [Desulfobulbus propionicus]